MNFEALFLKTAELTESQNTEKVGAVASLGTNPYLREMFDTTIRLKVSEALNLLRRRKFEEAFTAIGAAEALQDMVDVFDGCKNEIEQQQKKANGKPTSNEVKY